MGPKSQMRYVFYRRSRLMLVTVILMTCLLCMGTCDDSKQRKNRTCECYKPVFIMHGVAANKYEYKVLAERIKKAHPETIIFDTNDYPDLLSTRPCWEQLRGKLGQAFSDKYPCGIIVLAHSQGTVLMRGAIEDYPHHNVHTFIVLAGVVSGQFGIPVGDTILQRANISIPKSTVFSTIAYNPEIQQELSLANYWRDPHRLDDYYKYCVYLPYIDNEVRSNRSEDYKKAFEKLKLLVAIAGPGDEVIVPWQSGHFGYYDENEKVLPYYERNIYLKNLFGLRTLAEAGRFITYTRPGIGHIKFILDESVFEQNILPYLSGNPQPCYNDTTNIFDISNKNNTKAEN